MSEQQPQPPGTPEPQDQDPWAPPRQSANRESVNGPEAHPRAPGGHQEWSGGPSGTTRPDVPLNPAAPDAPASPHVHSQPTVTSMPTGAVPPPPTAPGGAFPSAGAPFGHAPGPGYPAAPDPYGGGYPAYPGYQGYPPTGWQPPVTTSNGMGVAAMVLGILALCLVCLWGIPGLVLGLLALIFGVNGRKRVRMGRADNDGMALSGIILGTIGMVLGAVILGLMIWAVTEDSGSGGDTYDYDYSNSLVVEDSRV
ncbi:DUF4190 domain-containing protein [Streptomyces sp. NPDC020141]|uniref:DUF4190 domain-containing protein n=1 Tax=Streptomyces sp. NPDC020141 TaxID=3365065 RepID=UPI00378FF038